MWLIDVLQEMRNVNQYFKYELENEFNQIDEESNN